NSASSADSNLDQADHFDAIQEIEHIREPLQQAFIGGSMDEMGQIGQSDRRRQTNLPEQEGTLSLVDTRALHDMVTVQKIIEKAVPRFEDAVFRISQQFSRLTDTTIEPQDNPFDPIGICSVFHDALQNLGLNRSARNVLFKAFETETIGQLDQLYDILNDIFTHGGIKPQQGRRKYVVPKNPHSPQHPGMVFVDPDIDLSSSIEGEDESASVATHAHTAAAGDIQTRVPTMTPDGGGSRQEPFTSHNESADAVPTGTAHDAYSALHNLYGLRRGAPYQPGKPASATGTVPPPEPSAVYGLSEVVDALSALQEQLTGAQITETRRADLKSELVSHLTIRGEGEKRAIGDPESDAIDFVSGLMDALLEDVLVSDGVKKRLARLEAPLLKLALLDTDFLRHEHHPARRFLNTLGQLTIPTEVKSGSIEEKHALEVDNIIDRICTDYTGDSTVFSVALDDIEAIVTRQIERYARNLAGMVKACQEEQVLLAARRGDEVVGHDRNLAKAADVRLPKELAEAVARVKRLKVGDAIGFKRRGHVHPETLAWLDDEGDKYIFVDRGGRRASSLGVQELAMLFEREDATLLSDSGLPTLERGIYAVFNELQQKLSYD
ncbi:MAG: DUF1631 domain-containing protein, partial [Gammaproteobacteria bacterium]|nr:DUF1631 domain-containing protein [Gammaproteobacteria bacterium]